MSDAPRDGYIMPESASPAAPPVSAEDRVARYTRLYGEAFVALTPDSRPLCFLSGAPARREAWYAGQDPVTQRHMGYLDVLLEGSGGGAGPVAAPSARAAAPSAAAPIPAAPPAVAAPPVAPEYTTCARCRHPARTSVWEIVKRCPVCGCETALAPPAPPTAGVVSWGPASSAAGTPYATQQFPVGAAAGPGPAMAAQSPQPAPQAQSPSTVITCPTQRHAAPAKAWQDAGGRCPICGAAPDPGGASAGPSGAVMSGAPAEFVRCPACNIPNTPGVGRCKSCLSPFPTADDARANEPTECPVCKHVTLRKVWLQTGQCPHCGERLIRKKPNYAAYDVNAPKVVCTACGHQTPSDSATCLSCGTIRSTDANPDVACTACGHAARRSAWVKAGACPMCLRNTPAVPLQSGGGGGAQVLSKIVPCDGCNKDILAEDEAPQVKCPECGIITSVEWED